MYCTDDVTILIATKGRLTDLQHTLLSFCGLDPKPRYIYIVDNSVDNNAKGVIKQFADRLAIRSFHLSISGKSRCLNMLLDNLETKVCLFTDDDVRVPTNWVACMISRLNETKAIAVQGEIHIPKSYPTNQLSAADRLDLFEIRDLNHQFTSSPFLVGANMAVAWHRCDDLRFDEQTGPGALGYMDDTLILLELVERGECIAYASCAVEHYFPIERLSNPAPIRDAIKHGRSVAYVEHKRLVPIRPGIVLFCAVRLIRALWYLLVYIVRPARFRTALRQNMTAFFHYYYRVLYCFSLPKGQS